MDATVTLYRPTGPQELALVKEKGILEKSTSFFDERSVMARGSLSSQGCLNLVPPEGGEEISQG